MGSENSESLVQATTVYVTGPVRVFVRVRDLDHEKGGQ